MVPSSPRSAIWTLTTQRDTPIGVESLDSISPAVAQKYEPDLVAMIDAQLHPAAILLYGSGASGRLTPQSDLDVAVLLGRREVAAWNTLAILRSDLEALAQRDVDLVILDTASPILRMEVLRHHRVLAMSEPPAFHDFFARTLADYFDLKRVRRPIEEALLKRCSA